MDKIIVVYFVPSDWGDDYEIVLSFNYESAEAWLVYFEETLKNLVSKKIKDRESHPSDFSFCGKLFDIYHFCNGKHLSYQLPEVYGLNEWFEKNLRDTINRK